MRVRRGRRRSYRRKGSKMRKRFDVQPQLMFGYPMQCKASAGDLQKIGVPVPMPRTYSATNPIVMELLKVEFTWYGNFLNNGNLSTSGTGVSFNQTAVLATSPIFSTVSGGLDSSINNPQTIAVANMSIAGNIITPATKKQVIDFQTNDGRGILLATDKLYFALQQNNSPLSLTAGVMANADMPYCSFRIWYRFMAVGMSEFVGIVNQQQAGGAVSVQ